jgi:mannose-6-phosphate isomerase-like protein (cupin superfamily)
LNQKVFQWLDDIVPVATAHSEGKKFVFLRNEDTPAAITQFAFGKFLPGETCEAHLHTTMEECFYFIDGEGEYTVGDITYTIKPKCFLRIPANTIHALKATGNRPLTFVYFGVAIT